MTRVVVVEDSPTQALFLSEILASAEGLRPVGVYPDAEKALAEVDWRNVEVLLADLELPGMPGVALIPRALQANPALLPLAFTVHDDRDVVLAALEAGACGYVLKDTSSDDLIRAIRDVAAGQGAMSPAVARHLIDTFRLRTSAGPDAREELSPRESHLLRLVAAGNSYKEIAGELGISPNTVHSHVKHIYGKLRAASRSEAIRRARLLGYLDAGTPASPGEV